MIIKDIREFRKFYKENILQINDDRRNENFIGHSFNSNGETKYGFFQIYHGDKEDINKFITPFLKMAQDWQAVYELLQNAYDADSKNFVLFFDEEYLLAFNNGKQFSLEGIRSILNIGQSTKESKSNIGKYGVGFKIVHRLIGETDGKKELNELKGPILFSWDQTSELEKLLEVNSVEDIKLQKPDFYQEESRFYCKDRLPWLFKILLTNFPCGPNEEIYDLSYQPKSKVFHIDEILKLKSVVKEKIFDSKIFNKEELNQGTIIFLNLGKNKHNHLDENHIKEGISYSLSILNSLKEKKDSKKFDRVYINDISMPFSPAEIQIEKFSLTGEKSEYKDVIGSNLEEDTPEKIEYLFGYSKNVEETNIKSNPNLYLYFPISDEIHNCNFILHCNYFENLSQRTNLTEGERNKKLLLTFSNLLIQTLEKYKKENIEKYTLIYFSILTSEWKPISNKVWVFENLLKLLIEYVKNNIPTKNGNFSKSDGVKIKSFGFDLNPSDFGVDQYDWFYWDNETIIKEATNTAKLNVRTVGIADLISASQDVSKINNWIKNNKEILNELFEELNTVTIKKYETFKVGKEIKRRETDIARNLSKVKLFLFSDENFYSIEDIINNKKLLIISKEYENINEVLNYLGFLTYVVEKEKWENIFDFLAHYFPHLIDINKFLDYLLERLDTQTKELSFIQIENLISFLNNTSSTIFDKIVIINSVDSFTIRKKDLSAFQYYVSENNPILKKYLEELNDEKYYSLADQFYKIIKNKTSLLEGKNIYLKLIEQELTITNLIDVIAEADSNEVKKEFINKISKLELKEDFLYGQESFEFKILDLVKHLEDETFKSKIYIETKNRISIPLTKISYHNKIFFGNPSDETKEKYELVLSKVLPNYSESTELVEKIIKSFPDLKEYNLRSILGIGKGKPKDEIINELGVNIENAHQLAFLLLYLKYFPNKSVDTSKYKIKCFDKNYIDIKKGKYYIEYYNFIDEKSLLADQYEDIEPLLKLTNDNPEWESSDIKIIKRPYITGNKYNCCPLKYGLKDDLEAQKHLFMEIFKEYCLLKESIEKIDIDGTIWYKGSDKEIQYTCDNKELLFGFRPEKLVHPDSYTIEEERLPDWIAEEINKSEIMMIKFLNSVGVNTEASEIVQLRKALLGKLDIKPDIIKELAERKEGYLVRTVEWITRNKIEISEKMSQIEYFNEIIRILPYHPDIPIPIVKEVNEEYLVYIFEKINIIKQLWYVDNEIKKTLSSLGSNILPNIFKVLDGYLIDLGFFPKQGPEKIDAKRIEIKLELDKESLINSIEYDKNYYLLWKQDLDGKFKIYKTSPEITQLTYKVIFNEKLIKKVVQPELIDIDEKGNIYYTSDLPDLEKLLEKIVGKNDFIQEHLDSLIQKKQNEPEEIEKHFDDIFSPPEEDQVKTLKEQLSEYLKEDEEKDFCKKLIQLLNIKPSKWGNGYIYHFSHLENAAEIIREEKIYSRNYAQKINFKDSASGEQIQRTRSAVHDYARFYYRPLTPTQWHNEGLGRRRYDDNPKCPVPIFFKIKVSDILERNPGNIFISNGNLSSDWAAYGNDYNFLRSFDFLNLYSEFGNPFFKSASQQEFIVKDFLDLSFIDYEIICRNEQDKLVLLHIVDEKIEDKISIDDSYFYNDNPFINVNNSGNNIEISSTKYVNDSFEIHLDAESVMNFTNMNGVITTINNKEKTSLTGHLLSDFPKIQIELRDKCSISLFYLDDKNKDKKWLIFKDSKEKIEENKISKNEELINQVINLDSEFKKYYQTQVRHYTLYEHTLKVLNEFDKYFNDWKYKEVLSKEKFKVFLAIHDIGKPKAFAEGNKENQHLYSLNIFNDIKENLQLTDDEQNIYAALLTDDPLGKYFQAKLSLSETVKLVQDIAAKINVDINNYFNLLTVYYQVDTGSYTRDADGHYFLEHLFKYQENRKIINESENRLMFSDSYELKYLILKSELGL